MMRFVIYCKKKLLGWVSEIVEFFLMHSFPIKALRQNLQSGRGAGVLLPEISKIMVTFGKDRVKGPLNSFYVNELPRIYNSNNHLSFSTIADSEESSVAFERKDGTVVGVKINELNSANEIYSRFVSEINNKAA